MAENGTQKDTVADYNYTQGIIVFALALAIIITFGIYVWRQSALLNRQYQEIESSLTTPGS